MHVDNLAIFDTTVDSESITIPKPDSTAGNILQVVAVSAICNAATFDNNAPYTKSDGRPIFGNATGNSFTSSIIIYNALNRITDAAILRFSDSVVSVDITRQRWINVYRTNFNSKVFELQQTFKFIHVCQLVILLDEIHVAVIGTLPSHISQWSSSPTIGTMGQLHSRQFPSQCKGRS